MKPRRTSLLLAPYSHLAVQKSCTADETMILDAPLRGETGIHYDLAIGRLDEIRFSDAASGQLLARVPARSKP